jgi:hypothetical protein
LDFLNRVSEKFPISNFTKLHPDGANVINSQDRWTDEQTGMTQLRSAFYRDAKVPKKAYEIIVLSMGLFNLNFLPLGQFLRNCDSSF